MVAWFGPRTDAPRDRRLEMIEETNRFLNWALSEGADVPRIPTRLVDRGGFGDIMRMRGARHLAARWWAKVIEILPDR